MEPMEGLMPAAGMVLVQVVFAGANILYKLALNDGMDVRILVAYRYLFAAVSLIPIAYFVERTRRPRLTWMILGESFLSGLFGCTLAQNFYVAGMNNTSVTFSSAMSNLIPSITFILTVFFGLENLRIRKVPGQAKVLGTIIGLGGAMLLTFYKGPTIWSSGINLLHNYQVTPLHRQSGNRVMGSLYAVASCLSYSLWLIIQANLGKVYPCPYSSTALMCSMASLQCIILAFIMQRNLAQWRMELGVRLLTVSYSGILASGMTFTLIAWCIGKKGPLYASVFNPLLLVILAILSPLFLNEKLHLGSVLGAGLIVSGLYIVLWGKRSESKPMEIDIGTIRGPVDVVIVPGGSSHGLAQEQAEQHIDIEQQVAFAYHQEST
ncbi:hypothetical protein J5N97_012277 [Dioscorea zingiberensis]|uniref:WAT1-related protein n=1 Tax=Dioscorea zingiberensis TaxID=325984 RepID=A0A9D5HHN9_9LILI|nr:hypothetical protein J5N97_012277 [Dioscorea zingiberensis]